MDYCTAALMLVLLGCHLLAVEVSGTHLVGYVDVCHVGQQPWLHYVQCHLCVLWPVS